MELFEQQYFNESYAQSIFIYGPILDKYKNGCSTIYTDHLVEKS